MTESKNKSLSDESEVEESMKIWRFKMKDIKKETVLSNLRLRSLKRRFVCEVKIFGKKSEMRFVGS